MRRGALVCALVTLTSAVFAQAPPPGGPDIPLIPPGAEVREKLDLRGEALLNIIRGESGLAGVRAVTILRLSLPRPLKRISQGEPAPMLFFRDELERRGWKMFWKKGPPGPPEAAFTAPDGEGVLTVRAVLEMRELVVTLIEGRFEFDQLGRLEMALRRSFRAGNQQPSPIPPEAREQMDRADALARQGKWAEAIKDYQAVVKAQPNLAPAYFGLGMGYKQTGDADAALKSFRRAIELDPLHPGARVEYARIVAFEKKNWDSAVYELRQAAALRRSGPIAWELLGRVCRELGRTDEAISSYEEAARTGLPHVESLLDLGALYEKKNMRDKAREAYERALRVNPDFGPARKALERLGRQ